MYAKILDNNLPCELDDLTDEGLHEAINQAEQLIEELRDEQQVRRDADTADAEAAP